jgi:hypothetical protein
VRLGRLYLRVGDHAAAEGAFEIVASPRLGPDDFGETFMTSPFFPEADVGRREAAFRMGGSRAEEARERLRALVDRYAGLPAGRRAGLLLRFPERVPGERALALAEGGRLGAARRAVPSGRMGREAVRGIARVLERTAWLDPGGVLALCEAVRPHSTSWRERELLAIAAARALQASGSREEAAALLESTPSERTGLARAELARRRGQPGEALRILKELSRTSELASVLLERMAER